MQIQHTTLGKRPDTQHHINGESFQQEAMLTCNGWQYIGVYLSTENPKVRHVNLFRRKLPEGAWQGIEFQDYDQTLDDGHNIISIGISPCDGKLHLAWDLHNSTLNYRVSLEGITDDPENVQWTAEAFGPVQHALGGISADLTRKITYPRFVPIPARLGGALLLEVRTGVAGDGDSWLFVYTSTGGWREIGRYLQGIGSSPYINGMDIASDGSLHVTWTNRDFVAAQSGKGDEQAQQAGPNGPENNHDLHYAQSPFDPADGHPGRVWFDRQGHQLGVAGEGVLQHPDSDTGKASESRMFRITKHSGIMNQESQCLAPNGDVYVLNREIVKDAVTWFVYTIPSSGMPSKQALAVSPGTSWVRGKIVLLDHDTSDTPGTRLVAVLPTPSDVLVLDIPTGEVLAKVEGAGGAYSQDVVYDRTRRDALSLFVCISGSLRVVDIVL